MQTRKHVKFTYLFPRKKIWQPVILLYTFHVGMSVFGLVRMTPPTASLPNSISTTRVAQLSKIADSTRTKSLGIHLKSSMTRGNIKTCINYFNLRCMVCRLPLSNALVCCMSSIWQPMFCMFYSIEGPSFNVM